MIAKTLITAPGSLVRVAGSGALIAVTQVTHRAPVAVTQVTQGLTGPSGAYAAAQISTDAGNALVAGSDQRLYTPEAFTVAARLAELAEDPQAQQDARDHLGLTVIDGGTFN